MRKSTADGVGARKFYADLTTPLPGWDGEFRQLVLLKKQVSLIRFCFVECSLMVCDSSKMPDENMTRLPMPPASTPSPSGAKPTISRRSRKTSIEDA